MAYRMTTLLSDGRRVRVVYRGRQRGHVVRFSTRCSGCADDRDPGADRGAGCADCGFTGRCRRVVWLPLGGRLGERERRRARRA